MTELENQINRISKLSELHKVYDMYKNRLIQLDESAAEDFRLNQEVKFHSDKHGTYLGKIQSIGRKGRIIVKLNPGQGFDTYAMGAKYLKENLMVLHS